jgi:hypothetical protein
MTAFELIGLVVLLFVALALPALGQSVRNWTEDKPERDADAEFFERIDGDRDQ